MKSDCRRSVPNFSARFALYLMLAALLLSVPCAASAQTQPDIRTLLETGQRQMEAARTSNTEEAYAQSEATFTQAVNLNPRSAQALLYRGLARLEHAGFAARQSNFNASTELTTQGTADMDAAVALSPDDLQVRALRGLSYAQFPAFMGKGAPAREDLERVVHHQNFAAQSGSFRARVFYQLGRVYAAAGRPEQAAESWRAAVAADAQSRDGQAAQEELRKLALPSAATDSSGRTMPDRFPQIGVTAGPIMVAATVTFPRQAGGWERATLPDSMRAFLEQLQRQPGLLGVHLLSSIDHPGMLVILTWWENKKALNNWFYSDTHQGIIKRYYGAQNNAQPGGTTQSNASMAASSQVGIELFIQLPGGMQFGGGLMPPARIR
ncbi:MAG TPA: antibiotic biosynthesis monooxygenase family protein [Pyrinomonadaceae bacterium]|nr:antibiotic biosynthesis monooxygenase family protein [Pyrinomonadaceae bacterium]